MYFLLPRSLQNIGPFPSSRAVLCNKLYFYGEELLAPHPIPKLVDHPLSSIRDCILNIFAATVMSGGRLLHPQPEDAPWRGDRFETRFLLK